LNKRKRESIFSITDNKAARTTNNIQNHTFQHLLLSLIHRRAVKPTGLNIHLK